MRIKRYTAETLKQAVDLMKKELGDEAIILSSRVIEQKDGKGKMFEVTAGVEDEFEKIASEKLKKKEEEEQKNKIENKSEKDYVEELKTLHEKIYKAKKENISEELTKKDLKSEKAKIKFEKATTETSVVNYREIEDLLLQREIQKKFVDEILTQLKKYDAFLSEQNVDSYVVSIIQAMIPTSTFEISVNIKPTVAALIGPTGIGKTTCIAKLAVISKILKKLNVGIISIDTYRLGALDQMKILAEIADVDFEAAYKPEDMIDILSQFKKKDLIFIDTVGRSQNNKKHLLEIKSFLDQIKIQEIWLTLSSSASQKTLFDAADKFKVIGYNGLIFTKLDEAAAFGNIMNVALSFGTPIKYLTNGQVIPDDIISANSEFIANLIYSGSIAK
jgi:flagellar biosynthesis protein FlhF